ncbi:diguanylate cyclase domain-containing protein [Bradyrhizobium sp. LHD-71]|uniref:sensor domain-containing diguanylate cyclase n=1 Tax=Bradyrhizobium sp. LHD-71 TaxID=3072141 RepID=UPI00280D5ABE|nr:diguanylate cyclase [Bradyrhizobium sp. LHD-71]MDQ8732629.1 diguanylate cyclase [Bradyrhizobium sp. LHD-71]
MFSFSVQRCLAKLKTIFDVRARLVLLALILVVPLMLDRVHILESSRASQVKAVSAELANVADRGAESQREMIKTVQGILQTAASVYVYAYHAGRPCEMLNSGLKMNLHGIGNISVVGSDGRIVCSTLPVLVGVDVSDRHYFHDALAERRLVLSNYLIGKSYGDPSIMAAFPTTVIDSRVEAVIVTSVTLNWLEELVGQAPAATGMTVTLIDGKGTVLASKPALDDSPAARAVIDQAMATAGDENSGTAVPAGSSDGRMFASARVPDTNARLIVSIDERATLGSIDRDIRAAYLQLGLVGLLVLVGAWFLSERLIIRPIRLLTNAATRLGAGDLSARTVRSGLPPEFIPLAQAFNAMAKRLAERERDLLSANRQLSVLASIDTLSGLANRRAFDSRLNVEWMKAERENGQLGLAMVDIDHFKTYNDTYGHLDGDACLTKVGAALIRIATEVKGFSARYGGEEFSLMLPDADSARMAEVGEMIRASIAALELPHDSAPLGHITVSVGIAAVVPVAGQDPHDLIEAADAALYMAKRRGRNTVVAHGDIRAADQVAARAV